MLLKYDNTFPKVGKNCYIAPSADVIGNVIIGDDVSVWFNAVIRGDVGPIHIGSKTNIQDCCILHLNVPEHPLTIGTGVTVGHGAILHAATIEDNCLIGMGATVLDGAVVESYSIVAAGSTVRPGFTVPSGHLVAGVPAKVIRPLTDHEKAFFKASANEYLHLKSKYLQQG